MDNCYRVLVGKANAWLAGNPEVFVINCETIDTKCDEEDAPVDTTMSASYDDRQDPMFFYRSLRYNQAPHWQKSGVFQWNLERTK